MGLLKAIDKYGLTVADGYHKISAFRWDEPDQINIVVKSYASKAASDAGEDALDKVCVVTNFDSCGATKASMNMKKAYAGVKADERFADAIDEI